MDDPAETLRQMAERERAAAFAGAMTSGDYTQEAKSYYDGVVDGLIMAAELFEPSDLID